MERAKKRPKLSRQRRERLSRDAEQLAVSDIYLENNPLCARDGGQCGQPAVESHHIVRGTAGRAASLANTDTYLPLAHDCHERAYPLEDQIADKLIHVLRTIQRLRGRNLSDEQEATILERMQVELNGKRAI